LFETLGSLARSTGKINHFGLAAGDPGNNFAMLQGRITGIRAHIIFFLSSGQTRTKIFISPQ
jgi:hypothetical protein